MQLSNCGPIVVLLVYVIFLLKYSSRVYYLKLQQVGIEEYETIWQLGGYIKSLRNEIESGHVWKIINLMKNTASLHT